MRSNMYDMTQVARRMMSELPQMGMPKGDLRVDLPAAVTTPGFAFNIKKSNPVTSVTFENVEGGWFAEIETNPYMMGQMIRADAGLAILHRRYNTNYQEIYDLIKTPGAALFFNGVSVSVSSIFEDVMTDATVIGVSRMEVGKAPAG